MFATRVRRPCREHEFDRHQGRQTGFRPGISGLQRSSRDADEVRTSGRSVAFRAMDSDSLLLHRYGLRAPPLWY
jgi:hypothetical protein